MQCRGCRVIIGGVGVLVHGGRNVPGGWQRVFFVWRCVVGVGCMGRVRGV